MFVPLPAFFTFSKGQAEKMQNGYYVAIVLLFWFYLVARSISPPQYPELKGGVVKQDIP